MSESLGVYVHIPFCIQRCRYCDFATYAKDEISPNDAYIDSLCLEIDKRKNIFQQKQLQTIYFGGGTPSLLSPKQIARIINRFKEIGFSFDDDIEITLEVNPATLDDQKAEGFRQAGVNRISIGCQTFNDELLDVCNREHNSNETVKTIELVKKYFSNFSLDLLFALPGQSLEGVEKDLAIMTDFDPPHISGYCLTLPEKHPMNQGRCHEEEQIEMFKVIKNWLSQRGLRRYEISNFAKPGFESRHNNLYWLDKNYWGLGLSAHSYKKDPAWGFRFWNPSSYKTYIEHIKNLPEGSELTQSFAGQFEALKCHESLTDFCHTHLRLEEGIDENSLRQKYGHNAATQVASQLSPLQENGFVEKVDKGWKLSDNGVLLSNQVFSKLLFSQHDVDKP